MNYWAYFCDLDVDFTRTNNALVTTYAYNLYDYVWRLSPTAGPKTIPEAEFATIVATGTAWPYRSFAPYVEEERTWFNLGRLAAEDVDRYATDIQAAITMMADNL